MLKEASLLFGNEKRTKLLVAIAAEAPDTGRGLARRTGIDSGHAFDIVAKFTTAGLLQREDRQRSRIVLDDSSFVAAEFEGLLLAASGRRVLVLEDRSPSKPTAATKSLLSIMGGPVKTSVLVHLARLDDAPSLSELARMCGKSHVVPLVVSQYQVSEAVLP